MKFEVEVLEKVLSTLAHKHIQPDNPGRGRVARRWGDVGMKLRLDWGRWEARAPRSSRTRARTFFLQYTNILEHTRTYTTLHYTSLHYTKNNTNTIKTHEQHITYTIKTYTKH